MSTIIDTRDLHDRLAELEERAQSTEDDTEPLDDDERVELEELQTMRDEITDWQYGETLIPEDEFTDYARELADDLGYTSDAKADQWPFTHIDWQAAADELRQDYTEVTYLGTTYLARAF